ncbi:MAG: hypothetical protein WCX65_15395 [bacterium]
MIRDSAAKNSICSFFNTGISRIFFVLVLIIALRNTAKADIAAETGYPATIFINSTELILETPPAIRNGEVFVPLTDTLSLALGADLETSDVNGRVAVRLWLSGTVLEYVEGETSYKSGGVERSLRQAPFTIGAWLAVPAASLFSELGFDVEFKDNKLLVTKKSVMTLIEQIPESLFVPEAKTEMPAETPPENAGGTSGEIQPPPFQYTYENSFEFINIKVSGDSSQSSLIPESDLYNKLNIRSVGVLPNGFDMTMNLKTSSTTNDDFRHGEVNNFNINATKGGTSVSLYDLNPKISRFVMKNYQMQGLQYSRKSGDSTLTAMWGKTPKKLFESLYNRYAGALRVEKQVGQRWNYAATHVRIDDTGIPESTDRHENNVTSFTGAYDTKPMDFNIEYAISNDRVFHESGKKANATRIEFKRSTKKYVLLGGYEQIGNEFVSQSTFFTAGRRERSAIISARLNPRTIVMTGTRNVLLMGESTSYLPLQINAQPFAARKKMKLTMNLNNEKSQNASGSKLTESRQFSVSDWFGETKLTLNHERRVQRSYESDLSYRTNMKAQLNSQLTKKLMSAVQYRKERKTPNSNPLSRFSRIRFEYALEEWSDIGITYERYYNGTDFNRNGIELDYRLLNNKNDSEITAAYGFYNYSAHNDNSISVKYSYIR